MNKIELKKLMLSILSQYGFELKGNCFFRKMNDFVQFVYLDKSQYSNCFDIECGIHLQDIVYGRKTIPLHKMNMRVPFTTQIIDFETRRSLITALDFESSMQDQDRKAILERILTDLLMPYFSKLNTLEDIAHYIHPSGVNNLGVTLVMRDIITEKTGIDVRLK